MKNPDNENKQDRIEPPQLDTVVRTFTTVPEYVGYKEANSISLHRVCTWWRCVLTDNLLPVSSGCSLLTLKSDQDGIKVLLISFHLKVFIRRLGRENHLLSYASRNTANQKTEKPLHIMRYTTCRI